MVLYKCSSFPFIYTVQEVQVHNTTRSADCQPISHSRVPILIRIVHVDLKLKPRQARTGCSGPS